ncbi:MAG TPA: hypothetical protein VGN32_19105, partial [Ktedonobacterales bacterium]|nr:hypothetical protein [Ktedonobacterales bacterium]
MVTHPQVCARCGQVAAPGMRYCAACGEAVDPALVTELRRLFGTLRDLDTRIAAGQGDQSLRELRADYLRLYLAQRTAAPAEAATAATAPAPVAGVGSSTPAPAPTVPSSSPSGATAPTLAPPLPTPAPRPARPAFSWQAFLAEQAIAIMAYLGGFLLLVATLTFEVGAWQVLGNAIKLAVVGAVYLVFGGLGFALRRTTRLRTVARAYLGVFALMTPLVALAVYRFELQSTGFPASGMLCVAALYATVVYLALALRTRLATYAYLGWAALLLAALAVVPWTGAHDEWWAGALGVTALALLAARRVRRFEVASILGQPATLVALVATAGAVLYTETLAVAFWSALGGAPLAAGLDRAAFAVAAVVLVPLAAAWSLTLREWPRLLARGTRDAADLGVAVFAAQAVLGVAVWTHAGAGATANLLAALAVAELGGALALRRWWPARVVVRRGMEGLALALAGAGALAAEGNLGASWPLVASLTAGVLVTTGIALAERARWWLLAAGGFLLLGYQASLAVLLPTSRSAYVEASLFACLAFALWALALLAGSMARARALAAPLYVDALAAALYTIPALSAVTDANFQTAILLAFASAAFVGAWRERQAVAGAGIVAVFGVLGMLPYVTGHGSGWRASALAVALVLTALVVRRLLGRAWAGGPYIVGLFAIVLAAIYAGAPGTDTAALTALDIPFQAWLLLLCALLAGVAALWEASLWAMVVPALLAVWAVTITGDFWPTVALTLLLVGTGMALRRWRGPWWNVTLYIAAICGSLLAAIRLETQSGNLAPNAQTWVVILLLVFGALAYLVATQERNAWVTIGSSAYVLLAAALIPGPASLIPTLALTFGLAGLGAGVRWRAGWPWALALYVDAVAGSLLAVNRVVPPNAALIEALLLVFAAVAYAIAVLEAQPRAAIPSVLYAAWAVLAQPNANALLPLALALAVAGLVVGRLASIRWSYPFYGAAAVAAAVTALLGQSRSRFEAVALLALALMAYVIAWVESRPDVLPLALALGTLALVPASGALRLTGWQTVLAFAALAWLYTLGRWLWQALPGLRPRGGAWWGRRAGWGDPRVAGAQVHRWAGVLVGVGAVVAALIAPDAFMPRTGATQVVALALLSLAGMLALLGHDTSVRLLLYGAGELVALAITWEARWLGADNVQAFII